MATEEQVDENAGARKTGIVVTFAEEADMPRVTAAIVTVVGEEMTKIQVDDG